jgi:hypothetical protein
MIDDSGIVVRTPGSKEMAGSLFVRSNWRRSPSVLSDRPTIRSEVRRFDFSKLHCAGVVKLPARVMRLDRTSRWRRSHSVAPVYFAFQIRFTVVNTANLPYITKYESSSVFGGQRRSIFPGNDFGTIDGDIKC